MKYIMEFLKIQNQLNKLSSALDSVERKLNEILMIHSNINLRINPDVLSLPKHLQQTVLVLNQIGRATAADVASKTGKARAVESHYLNQLVLQQYAMRSKCGRQVIFSLRNMK
jgi:hypothetical protein